MIDSHVNHHETVRAALASEGTVDEQTYASLAILSERLERVRALGGEYANVALSEAAEKLHSRQRHVAVS